MKVNGLQILSQMVLICNQHQRVFPAQKKEMKKFTSFLLKNFLFIPDQAKN
jgi:hypothetical protein